MIAVMIMVMVMLMVMVLRRDTRVFRRVGKIRWIDRHRHALHQRRAAGKARLLRKRTQQPAAGGRGIHERIGNVVPDDLVCRGIEGHAGRRNWARCSAILNPIDQRREHIKLICGRSAGAVIHVWNGVEPGEVLSLIQTTELLRHLLIVQFRLENGRARIAESVIPDDLVPVVDEVLDVERRRSGYLRRRRIQQI